MYVPWSFPLNYIFIWPNAIFELTNMIFKVCFLQKEQAHYLHPKCSRMFS